MCWEGAITNIPGIVAGEDLSAYQYHIMIVDSSAAGTVVRNTVAGEVVDGVLQNEPDTGEAASVACAGVTKCVAGAAITPGQLIMSNAVGRGVLKTVGNSAIGRALSPASAAGELFSLLLNTKANG